MTPLTLKNTYYVMRHGQSLANVQDLIVSHPDNGLEDFGLSDTGRRQAADAFFAWEAARSLDDTTVIFSSDFQRARDTAQIAARALGCTRPVAFTSLLRERSFGTWEMTGSKNYQKVWADDARKKTDLEREIEAADQVLERGLACLKKAESAHSGKKVLLVSHGDTLQILMTWFAGISPFDHRSLPHLDTAEIRQLTPQNR